MRGFAAVLVVLGLGLGGCMGRTPVCEVDTDGALVPVCGEGALAFCDAPIDPACFQPGGAAMCVDGDAGDPVPAFCVDTSGSRL